MSERLDYILKQALTPDQKPDLLLNRKILNQIKGKEEMKIRKVLKYPPYYNLCLIKVSGKDYNEVFSSANKIADYLKNNLKSIILGPASASMPKINNVYYVQIIIKFKKTQEILTCLEFIRSHYKNKINVDIDLNPLRI